MRVPAAGPGRWPAQEDGRALVACYGVVLGAAVPLVGSRLSQRFGRRR
ncbi:hypothetical protein [Streptomyces broussonetiae]|uniref:Uncharacterized protein n=1 Tax=Streptomyces broussonetiae TaxID=2686304 RepID=A0A6I6MQE1_9ACTN|nr:hypothetical protein [Streptomyces broussonetiae]QHA02698.1 hypothetical protein GQF42_04825 [Streptomyces broussonetiae]